MGDSSSETRLASKAGISVIVRTLGTPQLADALESLAGQTRRDFELVFVDMSDGRAGSCGAAHG
jgi:hypothetical protein